MYKFWILVAIAGILMLLSAREMFSDPRVKVPSESDKALMSKIEAAIPFGQDAKKYVPAVKAFYDKVYVPAELNPKDKDIDTFLETSDAANLNKDALRQILTNVFYTDSTITAASKEEKQVTFKPSEGLLQPDMAKDPLYKPPQPYSPEDSRDGPVSEGIYEDTAQMLPRREGQNATPFYSVCPPCAENVY